MPKRTNKQLASPRLTEKIRKGRSRKLKLAKAGLGATPAARGAGSDSGGLASRLEPPLAAGAEVLDRLWSIIDAKRNANSAASHSTRLLAKGTSRVAQKLGEEAVECLIEIVSGNRAGSVAESADLLYHLVVAWVHIGIYPEEVWQELHQRETVSHLAEIPRRPLKRLLDNMGLKTSKIP